MNYMTTKEASKAWSISDRRIRVLCEEGRIEGALKIGRNWSIPVDCTKPIDARVRNNDTYFGVEADFKEIDDFKHEIDSYRPFSLETLASLRDNLIVEWTYNSNAIEGNTLTLSETKVVLEGITVGGKSMVEHLEAINHKAAILFLESIIQKKENLSERNIKNIHQLILKNIDNSNAGKYRQENVLISSAKHIPPSHFAVPEMMQRLIHEYQTEWSGYHPVVRAALLHGEFVKIHPFIDGNGRTARILLNFELMRTGYPPIVIKNQMRAQYYDALDHAHVTKDYKPFVELVVGSVMELECLWLKMVK